MNYQIKLYLKNSFLVCCLLLSGFSHTVEEEKSYALYPQPDSGYVTDYGDLLTYGEEERIEEWLWQVESRSQVEIIVVTLHSIKDFPGTKNGSIESFATALFDTYGIGNVSKNDGVLLLVARGGIAKQELN